MNFREFEELVDKDFSGVIYIGHKDSDTFSRAYGYADKGNLRKNEISTKFPIASGGKVFTAVSIMQLIEKGLLSLEDSIGDIFDFDLFQIDKEVTVHELLNHTSGIPDYFDEDLMEDYEELWVDFPMYKIRNSSALLPLFIEKPMKYPRGSKFQYNNSGYVMLGLIIERVTGESFDEYIRKNIFEPCAMKDSGYFELDRLPGGCANAYIYEEASGTFRTNIYSVDVKGTGAGGVFTTAFDMIKFWKGLLEFKLISKELTKVMLTPKASLEKIEYGYGVWLRKKDNGSHIYTLMGSDPGVSFNSFVDPETNLKVVIMSNVHDNVWKYNKHILDMNK